MRRTQTCTICGQPALRGARLCAPCRAALKRAGQHTVQDLPHYRDPVPRARSRRHAVADAGDTEVARIRRPRRGPSEIGRRAVLAAAALAALAGVAYLGQPQWSADSGAEAGGEEPAHRPHTEAAAHPPPVATAAPVPAAVTDPPPSARAARASGTPPAGTPRAAPAPSRAEPPPLPVYPPLDAFGVIAEAPRAPSPPPVAVPRAAPPPDRWQQLGDALAQCEREGGLSGFLCDQRTRIDACDGYWGRVPQCPAMPENPR